MDVNTVRNYFGSQHFDIGVPIGTHYEKGPDGGVVTLNDTIILDCAMKILNENRH